MSDELDGANTVVITVDESISAMLEDAYRQDDEARRDFEQWQQKHSQVKRRSGDFGLIYKTHHEQPMQQQQTDWSGWDRWAEAHIKNALEQHAFNKIQVDAIGGALAEIRKQLRDEFNEALASLRADMSIQVGVAKGEIAQIKGKADAA